MSMIRIGSRVEYDAFEAISFLGIGEVRKKVVGKVIYINRDKGWFTVECNGIRTTFRLTDIGDTVKVIK